MVGFVTVPLPFPEWLSGERHMDPGLPKIDLRHSQHRLLDLEQERQTEEVCG